jgi:hypothetical protein
MAENGLREQQGEEFMRFIQLGRVCALVAALAVAATAAAAQTIEQAVAFRPAQSATFHKRAQV